MSLRKLAVHCQHVFNSGPVTHLYLIRNEFGCELDGMRVRRKGGKVGDGEGGKEEGKKAPPATT